MTGNGSNDAVVDPPPPAAPGTTAAVMADFTLLLEKHVTALNGCIDTLKAETASNHGHITKRLFPALEERFAHLKGTLATTTEALEAKGASLLAKCTALEDRVSSVVDGRVKVSESATASPHAWSGPREPPDDPPHNVVEEAATSLADTLLDVNARTRLAYDRVRAMNLQYHAPRATPSRAPATTRRDALPVRNPYLPRDSLRQTTLPETFVRERGPGVPAPIDALTGEPGAASGTGDGRPIVGVLLISPRHRDRDLRARTLGAS
jgi:hypothetical protein